MWAWHDAMWPWGGLLMIAFWALVIGAIAWAVRRPATPTGPPAYSHHKTALDVLDRRFALGEIDEAEYRVRRELLSKPPS